MNWPTEFGVCGLEFGGLGRAIWGNKKINLDISKITEISIRRLFTVTGFYTLSIANFFLMTDSENRGDLSIEVIPHNVTTVAKIDQPFTVHDWQVLNRPANLGLLYKNLNGFHNRFSGTLGRSRIFFA